MGFHPITGEAIVRCRTCHGSVPDPAGCWECNPQVLGEKFAELKEEHSGCDDALSESEHTARVAHGDAEDEREAAKAMRTERDLVRAGLVRLLWNNVADQDEHCSSCTDEDPAALCIAWRSLSYGPHWPGWRKAQDKLQQSRNALKKRHDDLVAMRG